MQQFSSIGYLEITAVSEAFRQSNNKIIPRKDINLSIRSHNKLPVPGKPFCDIGKLGKLEEWKVE